MVPKKDDGNEKRDSLVTSADWRKSLQVELRRVRSMVKEIAGNYVSKLEGRAEDIARTVGELEIQSKDDFTRLIRRFRELNVKPHKGRRKDLRQLEELIEGMQSVVETMREKQEKEDRGKQDGKARPAPPKRQPASRRARGSRRKALATAVTAESSDTDISADSSPSSVPA